MNINVADLVSRMGDFAATARDDKLSVIVSRVANRVAHQGAVCERDLTAGEMRVVRCFLPG
tara:strand:+ start:1969 stop:2151 length:183 start_codon:yes stop_codon:yes gene_type:complete